MLDDVSWAHIVIVVAGAVVAVALADVMEHRNLPTWPVGLIALSGFIIAGITYSSWIAASALGIGCGALIVSGRGLVQAVIKRRRTGSRRNGEEQDAHRRSR
ncbi:hypothetical protein [Brevibacterium sp. CFH 10365]|uniref:hypothetical protein n=1 Tax=Brevibacterium sp. CFH 10365 TaxID=2585207 RepID=UPI0012667907|nr:hypothetical protein [Brevibacterium sp. CFH 10365]